MAKVAKDQMKVKTALETYVCKWSFETPVEEWAVETLVANIRAGLRYAISRKINLSVAADEQNMNRNTAMLAFMKANMAGDPESMAKINDFCKLQNIRTEVQTDFVFKESDFAVEIDEDEDGE